MGNFNRDNRDDNKRDFRRSGFGGRGIDRQMFPATCSDCGKDCQVPFKPTGSKPVFCSECFEKKESTEPKRHDDKNLRGNNYSDKQMYRVVCDSCGSKCEVPFRPTNGKPVYCQQCFKKSGGSGNQNTEQFKEQFDKLNAKLDQILKALTPVFPKKAAKKRGFGKAII